jgi:hypothetical protein
MTIDSALSFFPGLTIVGEQPPAIRGQFRHCTAGRRSKAGYPHHAGCPLLEDCRENQRRGGGALCETFFVIACGGEERTL